MAAGLFEGRYVWHPAADDHEPASVCVDVRAGRHPNADAVLVETRADPGLRAHRFLVLAPEAAGSELTRRRLAEESGPEATLMWARVAVMRGSVNAVWDVAAFPARRAPAPHRCGCCPSSPSSRAVGPGNRRPTASGRSPGGAPPRSPRSGSGCPRWPVTGSRRCPTRRISCAPWSWPSARSRHRVYAAYDGALAHASLGASSVIPRNGSRAPAASAELPVPGAV